MAILVRWWWLVAQLNVRNPCYQLRWSAADLVANKIVAGAMKSALKFYGASGN